MPRLAKKVLSQFIRSGCMRRLRLDLYPDIAEEPFRTERRDQDMPKRMEPRPGFGQLMREGRDWERSVYKNLVETFGIDDVLVGSEPRKEDIQSGRCFTKQKLVDVIRGLRPGQFIIEPEYSFTEAFRTRFNLDQLEGELLAPRGERLAFSIVRPDIIQVTMRPEHGAPWFQINGQGDRLEIAPDDTRLGLRIIDIKLTAEPSPSYFSEIALYSMVLADWLEENGFSDRFFVDAIGAVWPGKHIGSALARLERHLQETENRAPSRTEAEEAMEREDLEILPDDIFTARVRRFLLDDLRQALSAPDWRTLDWHVANRCIGCDYLGYRWSEREEVDDRHCWLQAEREGHLSRVTGITKGARLSLQTSGIRSIRELAGITPGHRAFEHHHTLKATRATLTSRAQALGSGNAGLVARSGTSASLPKWADISIFISVDFDRASGITIAFGWRAKAWEDGHFSINGNTPTIIVEERSIDSERHFLLQWLHGISRYINDVRSRIPGATIQIYLWDEVSYQHLARIYARHLDAILGDQALAAVQWLFPPDTVFEDSRYQDGKAPLTIVQPIVASNIAADIPHYYNLIELARMYYPAVFTEPPFTAINSYFRDPLSDHVPSERAHEIWSKVEAPIHYQEIQDIFRRTVRQKLLLVDHVISRLSQELPNGTRPDAPGLNVLMERAGLSKVCWDGQLWYEFTCLNDAMVRYENELIRAMPTYEREAKFHSARLEERLTGDAKREVLVRLGLNDLPTRYVFRISNRSIDAKIRPGRDFFYLMPENWLHLSTKTLNWLEQNGCIEARTIRTLSPEAKITRLHDACEVKIRHFDRQSLLLVADGDWWYNRNFIPNLENDALLTFNFNLDPRQQRYAIVDPLHKSFLAKKVRRAVQAIGNPPLAQQYPLMANVPAHIQRANRRATPATPVDRFLWDAGNLATEIVPSDPNAALEVLAVLSYQPTDRQKDAFDAAMTRRLFLLWGPPGTGKSETAAAIIMGKICLARQNGNPLRILVTGPTWVAIDTVCRKLPRIIQRLGYRDVDISLTHSPSAKPPGLHEDLESAAIPAAAGEPRYVALINELQAPQKITIVATTPHQVPRLIESIVGRGPNTLQRAELFDFVLIDEASQLDVATALLAYTGLAQNSCVTVVGDNLQMPPIHAANIPETCKDVVGSVYDFYRNKHSVVPVMLDVNFRSNREIVDFIRHAGYWEDLHSDKPELRVNYPHGLPVAQPEDWPTSLAFSEAYADILSAGTPLVCIIHEDGLSAQSNRFEANLTAALVRVIYGSIGGELSRNRQHVPSDEMNLGDSFFEDGVGIVTPHKAQQAEVVRILSDIMPPELNRDGIRSAVDTVERFQGQEKNVMIATFALGDPDTISLEEEFIFGLERFNVVASRARAKLIVIISRELADHLPSDVAIMRSSRLLKRFVDAHLAREVRVEIPFINDEGQADTRHCLIRT